MLRNDFRPWGPLQWTLRHLDVQKWSSIGVLSTEHRCLATWRLLKEQGLLSNQLLMKIEDFPSCYSDNIQVSISERYEEFCREGGHLSEVQDHKLFERDYDTIQAIKNFAASSSENVVVDISSFPKRFFFLVVKFLLAETNIQNLIVTYAIPEKYLHGNIPLAQDPEPWRHLSTFMPPYPEPEEKTLVVGVGYEPLGLTTMLEGEDFRSVNVKLLFPFPAPPQGFQKNWNFVRQFGASVPSSRYEVVRVNTHNVSEIFDRISTITNKGRRYSILAPFGPKPVSLAMCLHAVSSAVPDECRSSVYYTQPKVYHPQYSQGIQHINGEPSIYSYCVRLNGIDLY